MVEEGNMSAFKAILGSRRQVSDSMPSMAVGAYADIVELFSQGVVGVKGWGNSIADVRAEVESRTGVPIKVVVERGTYFISSGGHQNMVARTRYRFELDPRETREIRIPSACMNAELPIPVGKDRFSGVARASPPLRAFLDAAQDDDPMTVQAGVWAITDGYTAELIKKKLRATASFGPGSPAVDQGSAISDEHITRARAILDRLGIRTRI
jgi:hypothetical protein